jgi:hypothetical protein
MILDERTELGDALSVVLTAGAAWQNLGDVIDRTATGNTLVDLGAGDPIYLVIQISANITSSVGAGTLEFRLVSDTSDNPPHVSTSTVHFATGTTATATTVTANVTSAGVVLAAVALPFGDYERYLGIQARVLTNSTNAGSINAFLTRDFSKWKPYADATN